MAGDSFPEIVAAGMREIDNTAQAFGIDIVEVGPGRASLCMTVRDDMLNSHATCNGGLIFTLADTAFAYSCNSDNKTTVAAHCSISFVSPGRQGEVLTARSEERFRQGRNSIYDVTVTGEDDRTVAVFQGTARQVKGESVPGLNALRGEAHEQHC
jgi:acyl-CoA thioesterase